MKKLPALALISMTLGLLSNCAVAQPQENGSSVTNTLACRNAPGALKVLERGNTGRIDEVVQSLRCYDGSQAEDAEETLGNLMISHPQAVFSALSKSKVPGSVIGDIASNSPSRFVDNVCGLLHYLNQRLSAIRSLRDFPRERDIAIRSIVKFEKQISVHCR